MKRKDFSKLKITVQKEKKNYFEHEEFIAGTAPYLRGIHSSMYLQNPIKNSLLVNLPSPKNCNAFLKEKISTGTKEFHFHFNLNIENKTVNNGISLNSIDDILLLFKDVDTSNLNITISANNKIKTTLNLFLKGLKQLHISTEDLTLNILLSEENTVATIEDVFNFSTNYLPKLNSIIILKTNELTAEIELANLLSTSSLFIENNILKEKSIDSLASIISFNLNTDKNHFQEIAKMRAARLLWAKMIQQFNPKDQHSLALKIHSSTNNTIPVLTAFLGGSQSFSTNKTSQLYVEEETMILKTVDPWAGSNEIEKMTFEIANSAWFLYEKQRNTKKNTL